MKQDITIPQGKFKIGRDIHEGVYLIATLNEFSFVTIDGPNEKHEFYTLDEDDNGMMVHVEVEKGDTLTIDGKVKMRHITRFIDGDNCNLLEEIENFERELKISGVKEKNVSRRVVAEEGTASYEDDNVKKSISSKSVGGGFWGALSTLLESSGPSTSSKGWATSNKKHSGKCDGDCANCPPHYGYRYGRWYYGHGHNHGCEFGGNKGGGGLD